MLTAFEMQLKRLANDPGDKFHENIRKRVGKRATSMIEMRLKNMILRTPKLLNQARIYWGRDKMPSEVKRLSGFVMTYIYHPQDFLPDDEYGLFGYLDDAYLVAIVYEEILRNIIRLGRGLNESDAKYFNEIKTLKRSVKAVIPNEAKKIEKMVKGLLKEDAAAFCEAF